MLCERCKKRPAMIYIQTSEDGQIKSKGYCLTCARELGIKPLDDMMKKMGGAGCKVFEMGKSNAKVYVKC